MGPIQSIGDLIGMILRRFWLMAAVFFLGVVITIVLALGTERTYETTAVIEFDVPLRSGGEATGPALPTVSAQQLQIIEQRLMARESLTEIIQRMSLFADVPDLTMSERVGALREAVQFQHVSAVQAGSGEGRLSAMLITVRLGDPEIVAELANEFARRVVEDTYRSVSERTVQTLEILAEQEARIAADTRALEEEISAFQRENQDSLPEGQQYRLEEIQRLREQLLTIDQSVQELQRERRVFETFGTRSVLGNAGFTVPGTSPVASIEAQLDAAEIELARARQVLPETNPELQRLEIQVDVLTEQAEELRLEARERFLADIDSQIELMNSQGEFLTERLRDLQVAMAEAPGIEVELAAMSLELTRVQERYAVAANQLAEAETAQMLLQARQLDSMRLLEPAIVPEYPVGPSRTRMALLGIGISGLVALAVGFLLELMNPVMRSAQAIKSRTGLTPVVTIPEITSGSDRMLGFGRQVVAASLFLLFCAGVVYAAMEYSPDFAEFVEPIFENGLALLDVVRARNL